MRSSPRFTLSDELNLSLTEAILFLKSHSRAMSIHTVADGIPTSATTKVIYLDNGETPRPTAKKLINAEA